METEFSRWCEILVGLEDVNILDVVESSTGLMVEVETLLVVPDCQACGRRADLKDRDRVSSPWQRPTNENGNCLIRRYVGKGTNLNQYKPQHLRAIEDRINTIPRRSLNWATAETVYNQAVAMTG